MNIDYIITKTIYKLVKKTDWGFFFNKYAKKIYSILQKIKLKKVSPSIDLIFKIFEIKNIKNIKAIIIGNMPYPTGATGIPFESNFKKTTIKNIEKVFKKNIKEIIYDERILLLNAELTYIPGQTKKIWTEIITDLIKYIQTKNKIIFTVEKIGSQL